MFTEAILNTIVHVLPYMAEGGTEKTALNVLNGLQDKYKMVLLAPRGEILDEFLKLNIEYVEFPELRGNIFKKINIYKDRLSELHRRCGIAVLHINAAHEFVLFSRKVLPDVPIIFHLHCHQGSWLSKSINYKLSALLTRKKSNILIAVSEEEKRIIISKGYPEDKIRVVYNGFESSEKDDLKGIDEIKKNYALKDSLIIGNLGRLNRTKRIDLLILAFKRLKEEVDRKMKLLIIGDGPEKKRLKKIVQKGGLSDDVVFPGFISRGDRILKIFDIFVLPTTFEGCSNVLIEAMSKKLPIVTSNIPSVNWMFEEGRDALFFEKGDVKDLFKKLHELIVNKELRQKMSESVFDRFQKYFKAEVMIDKIDHIYQTFLQ